MSWTRSNPFRALVVGLLALLVVVELARQQWGWVAIGSVLLVVNVVSWRRQRRAARPTEDSPDSVNGALLADPVDTTLDTLLGRPGVQQAWSAGPAVWQQVSYLDDEDDLQLEAAEVAEHVWLVVHDDETVAQSQTHCSVAVDDELKPLLDLDVAQDDDPLVAVLAGHPSVAEVEHSDREVYDVVLRAPLTLDELAVLAARGLVAHHLDAVRRLR